MLLSRDIPFESSNLFPSESIIDIHSNGKGTTWWWPLSAAVVTWTVPRRSLWLGAKHVPNWKWVSSKAHPFCVATRSSLPRSCCFNYCFLSPLEMPVNVSSKMSLNYILYHIFMVEFIPTWYETSLPMKIHCLRRAWRKLAGLQMSPATASCCKAIWHLGTPTLGVIGCWLGVRTFWARWWGGRYQQWLWI